ncbi:MAG: tripartite tricarboxylate transporter TctB family protein [Firmicutes bacterium]|nr:tripartite tricarboxylate transporter TctB family protein [Bacillota bacterium]
MQKADFWAGVVIMAVALGFIGMSFAMPWRSSEWGVYAAPGLVPVVLGVVLFGLALILSLRAAFNRGFYEKFAQSEGPAACAGPNDPEVQKAGAASSMSPTVRVLTVIALAAVYVFVLMGRVNYIIASAVFVSGFVLVFKGASVLGAIVTGILTSVAVWAVFTKVFLVTLP